MEGEIDIIIIRGAPGSGKSQAAKKLSHFYPKGVRLEIDTIRHMVISVDWTCQQEHIDMLQASTKLVYEFLKLSFRPIIIVDTFSGDKANRYLDTLYQLNEKLSIKIIGLYTTDNELKRRLDLRINDEFRDFKICKKLNDDVFKWKHDSEFQIDTTGLSPSQTAEIIFGQINREQDSRLSRVQS